MKILSTQGFGNGNFNAKNQDVSFRQKIILDIGASDPRGSLKVLAQTDDGRDLYKKTGMYLNSTQDGFKSNQDFIDRIKQVVEETQKTVQQICKDQNLPEKEQKLSGLAVFVPGTTMGDRIAFMPNLRDKQNNSLKGVDFTDYKNELISGNVGFDVNKDEFKFVVTKDLGGAGIGIAKILAAQGKLNEGDYIMGVMTGGGFGSVDIKVKNGNVEIETSESSSYLTHDAAHQNLGKLGRLGVTVKSHINRYMTRLGMDEMADLIVKAGDARIVTNNEIHINTENNQRLINTILADRRFKIKSQDDDQLVIMIDDSNPAFVKKMKTARIDAVNDYADSIALIAINKINDCLNKVILVGPFAHGVDKYVKQHSEEFGCHDLPELINMKVDKKIKEVDLPSSAGLKKLYNFEIICDPRINFPDNTYAGDVLLDRDLKFVQNRGSWMSIPKSELQ